MCGVHCLESTREISLADVLRAIEATGNDLNGLVVSPSGYFLEYEGDYDSCHTEIIRTVKVEGLKTKRPRAIQWNLALPLDEQEQEVIEFLAKILGV